LITDEKNYGLVGWREFTQNREAILREYDAAKKHNRSRPVKTSHGNAGEAEIRKWLTSFLPGKFGVTSGYIIPDIIQATDHYLYEYDVIIYDKDNSPVLWAEGHADMSEQGHRRAIPARHVKAVMEVKSNFNRKNASQAVAKLRQMNDLHGHLTSGFSSFMLFFDYIHKKENLKSTSLDAIMPVEPVLGYCGGIILRSDLNADMVGMFSRLRRRSEDPPPPKIGELPLAMDIDTIPIRGKDNGQLVLDQEGSAVEMVSWDGQWHCVKQFAPWHWRNNEGIELCWSYGNFSKFTTELIGRLEGRDLRDARLFYGQIFDKP
jgi:hypothetical protein